MSPSRTEDLLEELLNWTKFAHRKALIETLRDVLADPKHLAAYEATDGTRSQGQVASAAGITQQSISTLWTKWRRLGIVSDVDGRACHLAKPSDLGIGPSRL
jgi:hypothetical protein